MINNSNIMEQSTAGVDQQPTANPPGKGKWTKFATFAVIGLAASLLTACAPGKYTGGGFINSAAGGNQKATFGFNLEGIDRDGDGQLDQMMAPFYNPDDPTEIWFYFVWFLAKGQFDYNDHGSGVQFHFDLDPVTTLPADGSFPPGVFWALDFSGGGPDPTITGASFNGPYTSRAGNGQVNVNVTAKGDQFDNLNGTIEVFLYGGPYDGYHNSGTIQGGNIQWHAAKTK